MPFGDPSRDPNAKRLERIYEKWIKPAVEELRIEGRPGERFVCHRSDREERPGEVISHVVEHLVEADVVVADLTGRNPNVFYELGVRHSVRNGTILIAQSLDDVPFDLRQLRTILYQYDPDSMLELRARLQAAISEVVALPDRIDNPVRRFIADRDVKRVLKEPASQDAETVRALQAELRRLSTDFQKHAAEVRALVEGATARPAHATDETGLQRFDGVWTTLEHGGMYCARTIDGELHVAYCFAHDTHLTAHMFNCRLVGNSVFARFSWIGQKLDGLILLKPAGLDQITGWWWHHEDVPNILEDLERATRHEAQGLMSDLGRVVEVPGMQRITLVREQDQSVPAWAEEYFSARLWEHAEFTT